MKFLIALFLLSCANVLLAAKIVVLSPAPSKSHHLLAEALAVALAKKGHQLTVVTTYPSGIKTPNYTEIHFDGPVEYKDKYVPDLMSYNATMWNLFTSLGRLTGLLEATVRSKSLHDLVNSNSTFDLVIYDVMMNDAIVGLGHRFKAPVIGINPMGAIEMVNMITGNSAPPSYVPSFALCFPDEMNFFQRVLNTALIPMMGPMFVMGFMPHQERLMRELVPDAPPLLDLLLNISLLLINAHYSWETPRPYLPTMIPVGGMHIVDEALPDNLKQFMDEAKDGVVLFSLGSNLKISELPPEKLNGILRTMSKFKTKFIWKSESDNFDVPKNTKVLKWVPQRAVLAHPNTKFLITHGGLLSVIEAIHFGIPFVGIPAFADQHANVAEAVRKEYAVSLNLKELNEETLTKALKEVMENPKYTKNIKYRSALLRDQPSTPLQTAVYWVEHVLKHKGAPHLKNAGLKLKWYQSYLLDVIAFLLCVLAVVLWINYYIFKRIIRFIKSKICGVACSKEKVN